MSSSTKRPTDNGKKMTMNSPGQNFVPAYTRHSDAAMPATNRPASSQRRTVSPPIVSVIAATAGSPKKLRPITAPYRSPRSDGQ